MGGISTRQTFNIIKAFVQGWRAAFAGDFSKAQRGQAMDLHRAGVGIENLAKFFEQGRLVRFFRQFQEIDHDDAADITQADLAGDFLRRLDIHGGHRAVVRAAVDVDGGQGGCLLNDDAASAGKQGVILKEILDIAEQAALVEQGKLRLRIVQFDGIYFRDEVGAEDIAPILDLFEPVHRHDLDPLDVRSGLIGDGALKRVRSGGDQSWRIAGKGRGNALPDGFERLRLAEQDVELRVLARRAQDQSFQWLEPAHHCHQIVAQFFIADARGDLIFLHHRRKDQKTAGHGDVHADLRDFFLADEFEFIGLL